MTHANLIRWEPFLRDVGTLAGRFDRTFDPSSELASRRDFPSWYPPVDIFDSGTAFVIEAELAGFQREDIDIRVENNMLTISGVRRPSYSGEEPSTGYLRMERAAGSFSRSFTLPATVDSARIDAAFRDGVLTVSVPKSESAMPRRIDIQ